MSHARNTIQKNLIRSAIMALYHPTAEEIYAHIANSHPSISKATVYRNLNLLAAGGEILQIQLADGAQRFDHNITPHYHGICHQCHKIFDVFIKKFFMDEANSEAAGDHFWDQFMGEGFMIEGCHCIFYGLCDECAKK